MEQLVREITGSEPRRLKILATDAGRVLFVTLEVGEDHSLTSAHHLAGEVEDQMRRMMPGLAEVIVHTEP